jgi:hypothetical protein
VSRYFMSGWPYIYDHGEECSHCGNPGPIPDEIEVRGGSVAVNRHKQQKPASSL